MTPMITLPDGRTLPLTLASLKLALPHIPSADLNSIAWADAIRRELVSRHRNPPEPNATAVVPVRV